MAGNLAPRIIERKVQKPNTSESHTPSTDDSKHSRLEITTPEQRWRQHAKTRPSPLDSALRQPGRGSIPLVNCDEVILGAGLGGGVGRSLACVPPRDSALPEPGALLRRLRSRRRCRPEVSEGGGKSASWSGLQGDLEVHSDTPAACQKN